MLRHTLLSKQLVYFELFCYLKNQWAKTHAIEKDLTYKSIAELRLRKAMYTSFQP